MNNITENKNIKTRGSIGILVIIVIAVLAMGGGAYFFLLKSSVKKSSQTQNAVNDISLSVPSLDFSASPLPDLNTSALNVAVPNIGGGNLFVAPSVDADFSYNPVIDIAAPNVQFSLPSIPQQQTTQPSGPTINASTCSQFSAIPSGYCSMAGASGQSLCEQCKAAGL